MIQFRNGPRPRNYLARPEQVRLFILVMFLMGIVWIAVEARNPDYFRWIWDWDSTDETVDTRFEAIDAPSDEVFVFPPPGEDSDLPTAAMAGPVTEADLAAIRDDQHFLVSEKAAWFKLFEQLQNTDSATLSEQSMGPVTFIQLYRQPKEYRAELVSLAGTLRRSEQLPAPRNDLGIESYYRTWLSPNDNPKNPIIVYILVVPEGFPEGMVIEEQVELEGFFFKRLHYAATDTVRLAPVVLAKSLRWVATKPKETAPPVSPATMVGLAAAMAGVLATIVWWQTRGKRRDLPVAGLFEGPSPGDLTEDEPSRLRLLTDPEDGDACDE